MAVYTTLPLPSLALKKEADILLWTDDALASSVGIYMGFTGRPGGTSKNEYASLNLGSHVDDNLSAVLENRRLLMSLFSAEDIPVIVPNQVHGTHIVHVSSADEQAIAKSVQEAQEGADALVVTTKNCAALLCYADCVPVIIASGTGNFAVAHAGWRGAIGGIVSKAIDELVKLDLHLFASQKQFNLQEPQANSFETVNLPTISEEELRNNYNVYIGPHIRQECFEVSEELCQRFVNTYGENCAFGSRHVNLAQAVRSDAITAGVLAERIADCEICTVCNADDYFSYRASGGVCGRHGAVAFRRDS